MIINKIGFNPILFFEDMLMINELNIKVSKGHFIITKGTDYGVSEGLLGYTDDDVYKVISDPDGTYDKIYTISIPDVKLLKVTIQSNDCSIACDGINCNEIFMDLGNSTCEFRGISSTRTGVTITTGTANIKFICVDKMKLECGKGVLHVDLVDTGNTFKLKSSRGMGHVTFNSLSLPREYSNDEGEGKIFVRCGMGTVNIYT